MPRSGQSRSTAVRPTPRRAPARWEIDQQQAYLEHDPTLRPRFQQALTALDTALHAAEETLDQSVLDALESAGLSLDEAATWDVRRGGRRWDRYPDFTRQQREHVPVEADWDGVPVTLDEGIAPLIEACWQAGLETVMSCEENFGGRAWIQFASLTDAWTFLLRVDGEAAADAYLQELVEALTPGPQRTFERDLAWWPAFDLAWRNDSWRIWASVRFPSERIESLTARLALAHAA